MFFSHSHTLIDVQHNTAHRHIDLRTLRDISHTHFQLCCHLSQCSIFIQQYIHIVHDQYAISPLSRWSWRILFHFSPFLPFLCSNLQFTLCIHSACIFIVNNTRSFHDYKKVRINFSIFQKLINLIIISHQFFFKYSID